MKIQILAVRGCHRSYDPLWNIVRSPEELNPEHGDRIYSIHWHWKIPSAIYENFQCIGFHSTDLPYGRGGSPIDNLIMRGFRETLVTAFIVDEGFDTGPVVMKRPVSLTGTKEEVLNRIYGVCANMIRVIEAGGFPMRIPQEEYGKTKFRRVAS